MEFQTANLFESIIDFPLLSKGINGRLRATFNASGALGGNFRVVCAHSRARFGFSVAQLFLDPHLAAFDFPVEVDPIDTILPLEQALQSPHHGSIWNRQRQSGEFKFQ
jgi:hypothetical protein